MIHTATRILHELKPFKKRLIIVAITGILMAAATAQTAVLFKSLMDGLQAGNPQKILQTGGYMILLGLIGAIARYYHYYMMNFTTELVAHRLRSRLQKHFMDLSLSFHSQYAAGSGGLISRILSDIGQVQIGLRLFDTCRRRPPRFFIGEHVASHVAPKIKIELRNAVVPVLKPDQPAGIRRV
jgi:ATP-binding cassette subfamily B protein/subfamily B ATP-binding cassette protein MsbA